MKSIKTTIILVTGSDGVIHISSNGQWATVNTKATTNQYWLKERVGKAVLEVAGLLTPMGRLVE